MKPDEFLVKNYPWRVLFLFIFEVFIQEKLNEKQSSVKQVSEQLNMEKYQI